MTIHSGCPRAPRRARSRADGQTLPVCERRPAWTGVEDHVARPRSSGHTAAFRPSSVARKAIAGPGRGTGRLLGAVMVFARVSRGTERGTIPGRRALRPSGMSPRPAGTLGDGTRIDSTARPLVLAGHPPSPRDTQERQGGIRRPNGFANVTFFVPRPRVLTSSSFCAFRGPANDSKRGEDP